MTNNETAKEITYSLDREKAIVVYLYLATKFKNCRKPVTFTKFRFVKSKFASMTLDEIMEYAI